jgi:hypothetical protein
MPSIHKQETPSSFHGEPTQKKPAWIRFMQKVPVLESPFAIFMCEGLFLVNPSCGLLKAGMPARQL